MNKIAFRTFARKVATAPKMKVMETKEEHIAKAVDNKMTQQAHQIQFK